MTTPFIKVTTDELRTAGNRVSSRASNISDELAGLRASLGPLDSSWAGAASAQFQALYREWDLAAANLREALSGISSLLLQAGVAYDHAEGSIKGTFVRV